jgi:hypothetical protein
MSATLLETSKDATVTTSNVGTPVLSNLTRVVVIRGQEDDGSWLKTWTRAP